MSKFTTDILTPVTNLLTGLGLSTNDIAKVVMAGGTSKIVKLQTALKNKFSNAEILSSFAPDEVIALGAAVQASYITNETTQMSQEKLMSLSNDILAVVDGVDEDIVVVAQDSTVPCKRSITLPSGENENLDVTLYWGGDKAQALTKLSLTSIKNYSKIVLSVHIHRDASTHVTLTDKTSGNSTDVILKM